MDRPVEKQHELLVRELFDAKADSWSDKYSEVFQHRLRLFLSDLEATIPAGSRILDFGCGSGDLFLALAHQGHQVLGVDTSPQMIQQAEKRLQESGLSGQLVCGTLDEVDENLVDFDAIICSSVIEYLWNPGQVMQTLSLRLGPSGFLLLTVPNRQSRIRQRERWLATIRPFLQKLPLPDRIRRYLRYTETSKNHYTPEELESLANSAGYHVDFWSYFDPRRGNNDQTLCASADFIFARLKLTTSARKTCT